MRKRKRKPRGFKSPYDPRLAGPPGRYDETWCCIDPGTNDIGYAIGLIGANSKFAKLVECGDIKGEAPSGAWIDRTLAICDALTKATEEHDIDYILLELPEHYAGSSGKGAGASNSQAIVKLSASSLALVQAVRASQPFGNTSRVTAIEPKKWKGQASKEITAARVKRAWGHNPQNHNAADAFALFDWYTRKQLKIPKKDLIIKGAIEREIVATVEKCELKELTSIG